MTRSKTILVLLWIAMMAIVSCQDRSNVVNPPSQTPLSGYGLPGVTIDSAVFYIYVDGAGNQTVNVHKITTNWAENSATWNSFGEAFDPSVIGSFVSSAPGWYGVDVKSLVEEWLDGTTPNFGLVLEQGLTAFTTYHSSEFVTVGLRPMLRIGYTTSGGSTAPASAWRSRRHWSKCRAGRSASPARWASARRFPSRSPSSKNAIRP